MYYSALRQQIIYNLGNKDSDEVIAMILGHVNNAIKFIDASGEWESLEAIVSPNLVINQTEYTYAELQITNMRKLYSVSIYDGDKWRVPMTYITPLKWAQAILPVMLTITDVPMNYTLFANKVILDRKPAATYLTKILSYNHPTLMTSDASVVPFANMENVIEALATWLCSVSLQDLPTANVWKGVATTLMGTYNLDSRRILNMVSASNIKLTSIPTYLDPFNKG